ncbi:MAG: hypothetical protein M1482_08325 [Chloroflexi bacterium]|nr:hypothetical protein [Chloroflexota bacterium]
MVTRNKAHSRDLIKGRNGNPECVASPYKYAPKSCQKPTARLVVVLGHFVQPDTLIPDLYDPQSLNRYSYVRNNPVRYTDHLGRNSQPQLRRHTVRLYKGAYMKSKTRLIATAFALTIALLVTWRLFPAGGVTHAAAGGGPLYTSIVVQNLDPSLQMDARLSYHNANGQALLSTTRTIAPFASITLDQPGQSGLPTTFAGSAVLDSDALFATVVTEYAGLASTLGKNFRLESYSGQPSTRATSSIWIPQLLKNVTGGGGSGTRLDSTIAIQNSSASAAATVVVTYTQSTGQQYVHSNISIPAGGSYTADLSADSALAAVGTFYGRGQIGASQPVSAITRHNETGRLMEFGGLTNADAATTLYAPQLLKNVADSATGTTWSSSVLAVSIDGQPVTATLVYKDTAGNSYTDRVSGTPMPQFDQRNSAALAGLSSFYGSGRLTANRPIVAIVEHFTTYNSTKGMRAAAYRLLPAPADMTRVLLPVLKKAASNAATGGTWGTGVVGRLAGGDATTVTLTLYLSNGTTQTRTASVSPTTPMFGFDQRFDTGLANGTIASGVLTTSYPYQPIVASVDVVGDSTVLGDAVGSYEGIPQ